VISTISEEEVNYVAITTLHNRDTRGLTEITAHGEAHVGNKVGFAHLELGAVVDVVHDQVGGVAPLAECATGHDKGAIRAFNTTIHGLKYKRLRADPVHTELLASEVPEVDLVGSIAASVGENALGAAVVFLKPILNVEMLHFLAFNRVENPGCPIRPMPEAQVVYIAVRRGVEPSSIAVTHETNGRVEGLDACSSFVQV
jgi:hypothetical protein